MAGIYAPGFLYVDLKRLDWPREGSDNLLRYVVGIPQIHEIRLLWAHFCNYN